MQIKFSKKNLIPIIILALGIIIRLLYVNYFGYENYNHDSDGHIEYIQFVAKNLSLPSPDKGWEFPQQPLYYIVMGILYRLIRCFLNPSDAILRILVWISALFSIGTLLFSYLLAKKITNSTWVQSFIVGVMAFTPALVYQAGMISNDTPLAFFCAGSFLFLVNFIKKEKTEYIILSIFLAVLAIFTKISGGIALISIFILLIFKSYNKNFRKTAIILLFSVLFIGFLCLSFAFSRAYLPSKEIRFVNGGSLDGQQTSPNQKSYFLSFNLPELVKEGQSYVFGNKKVGQSFPTYLYGTSIFGEYNYKQLTDRFPGIKTLMQLVFLIGLILPLGLLTNLFFLKKWGPIDYIAFLGCLINLALVIFHIYKNPSVCNSDFRFFSPIFLGIIYLSSMGILRLNRIILPKIRFIIPALCIIFISSEFIWISTRITIKILTNA